MTNLDRLVFMVFMILMLFLEIRDGEKHRELNSIKYCINACEIGGMVQVHTEYGCYCLDQANSRALLWEPETSEKERLRIMLSSGSK